jgi:CO/xanthine dehydrogenase Mo-binding subunit
MFQIIGKSVFRKESLEKVTGAAKYTGDYNITGLLHASIVASPYAHAKIKRIETSEAWKVPGVRTIVTGKQCPILTGSVILDRPPIAVDKVRYHGEPVAVIVADSEQSARKAAALIKVDYIPLDVVNSPHDAIKSNAPLVHENVKDYKLLDDVYPEPGTNIANRTKIRKGNIKNGWAESQITIESTISFPQSDHVAMETRCSIAQIKPDGEIIIHTSSQTPFTVKRLISLYFNIEPRKVTVITPLVGGAFGGKTSVQLEILAYLASKSVGGKAVKMLNSREEDMITSPVHIGLDAKVKLGCTTEGKITAGEITHLFDSGAYSDRGAIISRAAAVDCTGPYNIDNLWCDSLCLYTNHPNAVAFRGFGHLELTFAIERALDILADKLNMDPLELRLKNAIIPGNTTPTQTLLNSSNIGNLSACLKRLRELIHWDEGRRIEIGNNKVRTKGVSCIWKNSNTPANAGAGAILTFNRDGSINIHTGAIEIGQGTKTVLAQILAEKMKMDVSRIHVDMEVDTQIDPELWKTAASRTIYLVGGAVLEAAEDAIQQLKTTASRVLNAATEDLDVADGRVFLRQNPRMGLDFDSIAFSYKHPDGVNVGSRVIGRGRFVMKGITGLDPETGRGNPGPEWTVGAQAVEVELDMREYTYKILKAVSVIDAGKVLNPEAAIGQIKGGMNLGLSFASREYFIFNNKGIIQNPQLRTYKILHFGENPEYIVDFVETPQGDAPYGARGIGEHGVIGMPAALANSLSAAVQVPLNFMPLLPEFIWKTKRGAQR